MRRRSLALTVALGLLASGPSRAEEGNARPPRTDYCEMLSRDIQGEHYGFLAGNKLYYVSGSFGAYWHEFWESETIGFTHPLFRDGRARGHGIATADPGGTGHDNWGWEFWRRVKAAYGTVHIGGKTYKHPVPTSTLWRPDRQVCEYRIGDAAVREEKFISADDVLCDIITSDRDIEIRFEGQSFFHKGKVPTFDGDPPGLHFSRKCESTMKYVPADNTLHLAERGAIMVKPYWKGKVIEGRMRYDGMSFLYSASVPIVDPVITRTEAGNVEYAFTLKVPAGKPVTLVHAVGDDYATALRGIKAALASPREAMLAKTKMMNDLLNEQIPYFRCSDPLAVKTYYYLWALYFMYYTEIGEGWDHYPHTQTAVNNFMGLHLWDSWAYIQAGSWVADKWKWGNGNALQWQYMVQFKNKANCMPDTFGKAWYSPTCRMVFVGATEPAWHMYRRSGDARYLAEVYDKLFKPLYWDNRGPTPSFGADVNAIDSLVGMAKALGRDDDVGHWLAMRPGKVKSFLKPWSGRWKGFYGGRGVPWKDVWALASLQSVAMPKDWAREMVDEFVLDTDKGFCSPVGVNTRAADSPPNGIFRCSTISSWLAIDGMFRKDCDYAGMLMTVNHLNSMVREWGYPVAPEAWNDKFKSWGSRYYNWDIAIVLPMIEWLAGVDYSIPEGTFTVRPHLPPTWDYIETRTPVVIEGRTRWVKSRVERRNAGAGQRQTVTVEGNPLRRLVIEPHTAGCEVLGLEGSGRKVEEEAKTQFHSTGASGTVTALLGKPHAPRKTLAWVTPRSRIFHGEVTVNAENLVPGTIMRYTLDGSEPRADSPRFDRTVKLERTTTLKLRCFGTDGATYSAYTVEFTATDLSPAVEPREVVPGLRYSLFELGGRPTKLPDFSKLTPTRTGVAERKLLGTGIDVTKLAKGRPDRFALHLSGYLEIPRDQIYNFHIRGDDGARLVIDGRRVVELNSHCVVDAWESEGNIGLRKGLHRVDLYYYQDNNRRKLILKYRPGDQAIRKHVPAGDWSTDATD
jgi:hypothetical protein